MSGPHRLLIIVNNVAAKARRAWPIVRQQLQSSDIKFDSYETARAGDATLRTRGALREGYSTIAVVGGDGTLSEVAEGFFVFAQNAANNLPTPINPAATLALLPAGTGDDFARGLIGSRAPLDHWLPALISYCKGTTNAEATRLVDVMAAACDGDESRFICLNASTMGIGGETGARVASQGDFMRQFSGEVRFTAAAVGALAAWRERRVRVTVDDEKVIEGPMNLVAVANGLFAGGGMMLSPKARIDDGKLDVVTASGLNRLQIMRELPRIHRGGHVANPKVQIVQGSWVRVETFTPGDAMLIEADGNVRGKTPVEFRIMPGVLRILVTMTNEK